MLLNESDIKTLIKDIIKEVSNDRGEYLSDDLLIFPDDDYDDLPREDLTDDLHDISPTMSSESGLSDKYREAVNTSVKEIKKHLNLHQVNEDTPIYDPNTYVQSKMDLPSMTSHKALKIIISVCRSLEESLQGKSELSLEKIFYDGNELPKDGGSHTIADIVAMFIPREPPQQEEPTDHQHL